NQRTPKKMRKLALWGALSARAAEGSVKVVETLDWVEPRTKTAGGLLKAIGAGRKALIVLGPTDRVAERSFRNLAQVAITRSGQLTAYDVLWADTVLFTTDTLGSVAAVSYDVSDRDFVMEPGTDVPDSVASSQSPVPSQEEEDDGFEAEGDES
ncbi:MAG: uL4 family ribosomal protein, partial [Acidimicrobiia bacterium]|nr:uL4 family ribosomal protein [Acidimicrobiia bacterium]